MAAKKEESTGLRKLLEDQLADLYYVEKQLVKALPKMAKKACNEELRTAFEEHLEETRNQVGRLEEIFGHLELPVKAKRCPAIDGILEEGTEIMEEFADDPALDAGLVSAAQKVEHYEITSYGSMKAWAEQLELEEVVALIDETLEEEKGADEKLTSIAEEVVNIEAETTEDDDDEEEEEKKGTPKSSNGKSAPKKGAKKAMA
jgi:ferritin-like metal-binding protein YciE